jgi:hypothetical protein
MRARKSGTIAMMGSIAGWAGSIGYGVYCATKFALVAVAESLVDENAHLGIRATIVEPGYFRTKLLGSGNKVTAEKVIDDLRPVKDPLRGAFADVDGKQQGGSCQGSEGDCGCFDGIGDVWGEDAAKEVGAGGGCGEGYWRRD